jgi:formate hydrogenlyase subunit 3/multisubunit Na+/H+ antiporter MnhD subunit
VKLVYIVGFIIKKFVTMHGHTNVKFDLFMSVYNVMYMGLVNDCKKLQGLLRKGPRAAVCAGQM